MAAEGEEEEEGEGVEEEEEVVEIRGIRGGNVLVNIVALVD